MQEHDLHAIAFPKLDDELIASLGRCTHSKLERYARGATLFEEGDREFRFFVVRTGEVEIVDRSGDEPKVVTVHRAGQFTGDITHLTGTPAIVSAVARTDCEVFAISSEALRHVLDQCTDFADIVLQAFLARRQLLREPGSVTGVRVIGSRYSRDTFRIREFLTKSRLPFTWLDLESEPAVGELLRRFGVTEADTPVVAWGKRVLLRNPSNQELADAFGVRRRPEKIVYDLAIVGGGPAGLAAAVYGSSEGLATVVLERTAAGGQAGASMRIENYLGFPSGLTGADLADRAVLQANRFGARLSIPTGVTRLAFDGAYAVLHIDGDETVVARCLLVATGADYRRLPVDGCDRLEGCGVYYAATPIEAAACSGSDVVVVGAGNSAGQAVVFLARRSRKVILVVRGDDLEANMSSYLARRIQDTENVEVSLRTEVRRMIGDKQLTAVELVDRDGEARTVETPAVFSFIGAVPRTDWLPEEIERDEKGFVLTGPSLAQASPRWPLRRAPFLLETTRPGVFAAGDVRAGSVKRVASAVGEGSMAVQ
ncbi:MAG TPA: FAD-dependent oxidoreductase, partial [Planctomycetota bacterium]|nr:FAD-dependent oxidoreductase [Planctomycetota bacterium]